MCSCHFNSLETVGRREQPEIHSTRNKLRNQFSVGLVVFDLKDREFGRRLFQLGIGTRTIESDHIDAPCLYRPPASHEVAGTRMMNSTTVFSATVFVCPFADMLFVRYRNNLA